MDDYSKEFKYWYERIYLQSPTLCKLEYDDEKMWEAWKAAQTSFTQAIKNNDSLSRSKSKQ
jgi:hypothetical protein